MKCAKNDGERACLSAVLCCREDLAHLAVSAFSLLGLKESLQNAWSERTYTGELLPIGKHDER